MKNTALIKPSAILILIAFAVSFFLPVYHNFPLVGGDTVGWKVARDTITETFDRSGPLSSSKVFDWIWIASLDLANLVTPLVLVMLGLKRGRARIPIPILVILALCALNSARFAFDPDRPLIGYWVWWASQLAALAIGIWSRSAD